MRADKGTIIALLVALTTTEGTFVSLFVSRIAVLRDSLRDFR